MPEVEISGVQKRDNQSLKSSLAHIMSLASSQASFEGRGIRSIQINNILKDANERGKILASYLITVLNELKQLRSERNIEKRRTLIVSISNNITHADSEGILLGQTVKNIILFTERILEELSAITKTIIKTRNKEASDRILRLYRNLEEEIIYLKTLYDQLKVIREFASLMWNKNNNYSGNIEYESNRETVFDALGLILNLIKSNLINERTNAGNRLLQIRPTLNKIITTIS